jgi:S-formylglutathione hydrolase FrmB
MSMGGFGAMNIALHHRDRYAAVASWSGYFTANTPTVHDPNLAEGRAYSPQWYAGRLRPSLRSSHPAISFYVGSRDGFAGENRLFDGTLSRLGVRHSFRSVAGGGHTWSLWVSQLPGELRLLRGALTRGASVVTYVSQRLQ